MSESKAEPKKRRAIKKKVEDDQIKEEISEIIETVETIEDPLRGAFFEDKGGVRIGGMTSKSGVERLPCDQAQPHGGAELHEKLSVTESLCDCDCTVVQGFR